MKYANVTFSKEFEVLAAFPDDATDEQIQEVASAVAESGDLSTATGARTPTGRRAPGW